MNATQMLVEMGKIRGCNTTHLNHQIDKETLNIAAHNWDSYTHTEKISLVTNKRYFGKASEDLCRVLSEVSKIEKIKPSVKTVNKGANICRVIKITETDAKLVFINKVFSIKTPTGVKKMPNELHLSRLPKDVLDDVLRGNQINEFIEEYNNRLVDASYSERLVAFEPKTRSHRPTKWHYSGELEYLEVTAR